MPDCHHCGESVSDPREGPCSTCGTEAEFCTLCGWWELGPEVFIETLRWKEITAKLGPRVDSLFSSCEVVPDVQDLVQAIVGKCQLMQAQWDAPSLFDQGPYTYRMWRPAYNTWGEAAHFVCGKLNQLQGTATQAADFDTRPTDLECRLHCMLLTFLSAYDYGVRSQQDRLILDKETPPLNIHDAAKLAEHHYTSHGGFFAIDSMHTLHDALTLRHLDTMEQYLKGNLNLQMAHALILSDTQSDRLSRQIAINAFRLYSALLGVFQPYGAQRIPNKGFFRASENGAAGIFTAADVDRHFYGSEQDTVKTAPQVLLHRLVCSFETSPLDPDYEKWFKFHTPASRDAVLLNPKLTDLQKIYLLSFQSLDDPKCPSGCKAVLLNKARRRLAEFIGNLHRDEPIRLKLEKIQQPLPFPTLDVKSLSEVEGIVHLLVDLFLRGQFPLQTCCTAANIGYIAKGPYKGLLEVFEQKVALGELLKLCSAPHADILFAGLRYRKTDADGAADQRKKSPFQYFSWRVQKDRMAHRFLPMEYREFDVTAAVAQACPVPTPSFTYGDHLILWKQDLLTRCTLKIGDSGKPSRSFLVLLTELLEQAKGRTALVEKTAVVNLLVLAMHPGSPTERLQTLIKPKEYLAVFPDRPLNALDLEAHLYGEVGIGDVDLILAPCAGDARAHEQQVLLERCQKAFNTNLVQLYDVDALKVNEKDWDWGPLLEKI